MDKLREFVERADRLNSADFILNASASEMADNRERAISLLRELAIILPESPTAPLAAAPPADLATVPPADPVTVPATGPPAAPDGKTAKQRRWEHRHPGEVYPTKDEPLVGIIAAQSLGEPISAYELDSFHRNMRYKPYANFAFETPTVRIMGKR